MVMIPDLDVPVEALERAVDERLREWVGPYVERTRSGWTWPTPQGALFAVLEVPAATEDDPEPTLEITRPLRDLGYDGALPPHEAIAALADGSTRLHARICIGPDPAGSRRLSLLLQGTLYLADLQREELDALIDEIGGPTRERG